MILLCIVAAALIVAFLLMHNMKPKPLDKDWAERQRQMDDYYDQFN